jgi:hypothetical protein
MAPRSPATVAIVPGNRPNMRYHDWSVRLAKTLHQARHSRFEMGRFDCVRLAAACVDSVLVDSRYIELVARLYADKRSAVRLLMRSGGLEELTSWHLGVSPRPRAHARHGDLVYVDIELGPALGVCTGPAVAVAARPEGIAYLALSRVICCWPVD